MKVKKEQVRYYMKTIDVPYNGRSVDIKRKLFIELFDYLANTMSRRGKFFFVGNLIKGNTYFTLQERLFDAEDMTYVVKRIAKGKTKENLIECLKGAEFACLSQYGPSGCRLYDPYPTEITFEDLQSAWLMGKW